MCDMAPSYDSLFHWYVLPLTTLSRLYILLGNRGHIVISATQLVCRISSVILFRECFWRDFFPPGILKNINITVNNLNFYLKKSPPNHTQTINGWNPTGQSRMNGGILPRNERVPTPQATRCLRLPTWHLTSDALKPKKVLKQTWNKSAYSPSGTYTQKPAVYLQKQNDRNACFGYLVPNL